MKKILVCGGTGFVGSAIVEKLLEDHQHVRVLTRKLRKSPHPNLEFIQGDIFDSVSLEKAMENCDTVINAAQFDNAPFENPSKGLTYQHVDGDGTKAIVETAVRSKLSRILYVSGAGTSEEKTEPWFQAKWRAEKYVKESGMNWTIFRPSWIYGPGDKSLNRMIPMIRYSPIVFILGKDYRIQPVYIYDVATIVSKSLQNSKTYSQIYEIAGPEKLTMKEILMVLSNILRIRRLYFSIPKPIASIIFLILEKIPYVPVTRSALDFLTMDVTISENEIKKTENTFQIQTQLLGKSLGKYL